MDYSLTIEPTNVPAKKRDKDEDKQIVNMSSDITPMKIIEAWKLSCPAWDGKINFMTRNNPNNRKSYLYISIWQGHFLY